MRKTMAFLATLVALSASACAGFGPDDVAGTYNITSTYTTNFEGYTNATTSSGPLTITEGGTSDIVINDPNCAMPATLMGDSGVHVPITICTSVVDGGSLQWTVSGSGNLVDGTLTMNLSGPATYSSGCASVTGTVTLQMSGTRL